MSAERLQKILSRAGIASRRASERFMIEGRVSVNGRAINSPALDVTTRDVITVAGMTPERVVKLLSESSVPFAELSAHRASLEEAYMELTRDAVEFRAEVTP